MNTERQRARSAKALANDSAIRRATIILILRDGIDAISFREVAREAGLTHGALYARFEDVEELLVDLWSSTLRERAVLMCELARTAADKPSAQATRAAVDFMRNATPTDIATVRVLLASRRFPILHEEMESFIHECLEELTNGTESLSQFSRSLVTFSIMMVEVLVDALLGVDLDYLDFFENVLDGTLAAEGADVAPITVADMSHRILAPAGDDLQSQLSFATITTVGTSGYTRTTISRIGRRAKCSPGAIYRLYPSKEDLVIAAMKYVVRAPWITINSFIDIFEPNVLAQFLYEAASIENTLRKNFLLEMVLAAGTIDRLRALVETQARGMESVAGHVPDISDEEANRLRYLIRSIVSVVLGVTYLSTLTKATEIMDYNQFAEPFRLALRERGVSSWEETRTHVRDLANRPR